MSLKLSDLEKKVLSLIYDIPVVERPFLQLAQEAGVSEETFIRCLRSLLDRGYIRRFGAMIRHRQAGIEHNAMVVWAVPETDVERVGNMLAKVPEVSHCYQRPPFGREGYNLFSMIHGESEEELEELAGEIAKKIGVDRFELIFSTHEFKKVSLRLYTEEQAYGGDRMLKLDRSAELFERARKVMPGGVNSPVRAFRSVGGTPPFIRSASGSRITDADGNEYIDYVCSWGPLVLGHSHPRVVEAVKNKLSAGTSYGAPTEIEVEMAEMVVEAVPSIEKVRFVSSGTEAVMSAIRLARGYTGRDKVIKFSGCYHGHSDGLLVKAGSGGMTFGTPDSLGVPHDYAKNTLSLPYNNLDAVRETVSANRGEIACVVVEPVAGNMGVVPPEKGFLEGLREITANEGIVLIFDEVITGFRVSFGGAQELYNVIPDMTCLGKIIGGGFPVGAFGGKLEIMNMLSPEGPVYQAGTLSGNPIAMTAGFETLKVLENRRVYEELEEKSARLAEGLQKAARDAGITIWQNRVGSMMCSYFNAGRVRDYESALKSDVKMFARFHGEMLSRGVYLAPSQFEAVFVSVAHTDEDLHVTIEAAKEAFRALKSD